MEPSHLAWRFIRLDETTSTNTVALQAAEAGEAEGVVVVADYQTEGRGRLQRTWVAPRRTALLTSILLRPPADVTHLAVTAVACAAAAACDAVAGFEPGLKWPNDLIAGGRKLGGILAEAQTSRGAVTAVVVGLGLNIHPPSHRPPEVQLVATDLDTWARRRVTRDALLDALLDQLGKRYPVHPDELLDEYRKRCVTLGQWVSVELPDRTITGTAFNIDDGGRLEVATEPGHTVSVEVGDVLHLRPG